MEFGEMIISKSIEPNGKLKILKENGERYIGEHRHGIPNGKGQQTWPGGQVYVGSFKDGLRDGWGVCTYPSGKKQNEYFIKGKYIKNRKLEK